MMHNRNDMFELPNTVPDHINPLEHLSDEELDRWFHERFGAAMLRADPLAMCTLADQYREERCRRRR